MTTSINPRLQKYYGKIMSNLEKGMYGLRIKNIMNYTNYANDYKKNFYLLKEMNDYGDSRVMSFLFISAGSLLLIIALLILTFNWN